MKRLFFFLLMVLLTGMVWASEIDRGARRIEISGRKLPASNLEIVVPVQTPVLDFAAMELQTLLKKGGIANCPIRQAPTQGAVSLILGDNELARKAGLDPAKLASEGFFIKRKGNQIFLLGVDDPRVDPKANRWKMWFKRGTLNAVYDFLERFAGVRFYFPGENGTVVPPCKILMLPEVIDIMDRPDLIVRENYSGKSIWYEKETGYYGELKGGNLSFLRQRNSDSAIPFGHGQAYLNLIGRFAKSHPEYFALMPDGRRYCEPGLVHTGHICYSSPITEEIYQDVKAYLTGKKASERGMKHWSINFGRRPFVSVMPQDWLYWCCCPACLKIADAGARTYQDKPEEGQKISNCLWAFTAKVANRLTAEKIDGIVTQMAYGVTAKIPECDLPKNVTVQLAVGGMGKPEFWASDAELIKKWCAKVGGKISLWTYPGKHMSKAEMKGIPAMMHRQIGKYIQHVGSDIYGVFLESETDYEIFNYLNYYTFAKVTWDLKTDLDQLLEEHYRLMYGSGAAEMETFFNELEDAWCKQIIGNVIQTPLGPVNKLPNEFEVWNKVFSPAKLRHFNTLFDRAEKAAAKTPGPLKRIRFMRKAMLGPILKAAEKFSGDREMMAGWRFQIPGKIGLRPYKGDVCEVTTTVTASETPDSYSFVYDCEEPLMKDIRCATDQGNKKLLFEDSCVELLLNPSGDRKNYFHFIVNADGVYSDAAWKRHGKGDNSWNSGCQVSAVKSDSGYKVTLVIPKKSLGKLAKGGFPVNFARHRALNGAAAGQVREVYYQWSPVPGRSFHACERWGIMSSEPDPAEKGNVIKDGDFQITKIRLPYYAGEWKFWSSQGYKVKPEELDNKVFLTGTSSLHLMNPEGARVSAGQVIKGMKPGTRYRLSYFLRTKDLKGRTGAGAYLSLGKKQFAFPNIRITGTTSWHKRTFDFETPKDLTPKDKCILGLWIWHAGGDAWYDHVSIVEVK